MKYSTANCEAVTRQRRIELNLKKLPNRTGKTATMMRSGTSEKRNDKKLRMH
jgi:hypothetical protein